MLIFIKGKMATSFTTTQKKQELKEVGEQLTKEAKQVQIQTTRDLGVVCSTLLATNHAQWRQDSQLKKEDHGK
jgi:hypothetical protein